MSLLDQTLYIIAEVANAAQGATAANHQIIDSVAATGADAIKFQFYKYDELATPNYEKYENFRRTFYSEEERLAFINHAYDVGLDVIIDIFDRWGLSVVRKALKQIKAVKIPPAIIMDEELVGNILELNKQILLGVGGYDDHDIELVLSKLKQNDNPIVLMHGFQGFPTSERDSSLRRIGYLKAKYGLQVGYADHVDAETDIALNLPEYAFFAGATIIEKHITLDRFAKGLDYYSSLMPKEFERMVQNLRRCSAIMGSETISSSEKNYLKHSTRVTTAKSVSTGEIIFQKDIKIRRTNNPDALYPNEIEHYFPAVALRDLDADIGVSQKDIKQANAGIIVVCRLNSKRLARKALIDLNGAPAIERCLINALASKRSAMTILATSTHPEDEELENHTLNGKVRFFQGSENDPAARMLDAAELYSLDFIVRVTGDSPLVSFELIDFLLESHFQTGADYSYFKEAPLGAKSEVISKQSIRKLKEMTDTDRYSEYLTLYFKNNPEIFHLNEVTAPAGYRSTQYRLNLDYPEDYEMLKRVFEGLDVELHAVTFSEVVEFFTRNPEIANINASIKPKYVTDLALAEHLNKVTKIHA